MKKFTPYPWLAVCLCLFFSFSAFSQTDCSVLQVNSGMAASTPNLSYWSGIMELPFLLISIFFAFGTASALRGGKFGKGMNLLAWGFLVMAIGHMHMQVEHFYGFNLFKYLLGEMGGSIVWFIALVITWGFSGLGFYSIYKASKGS